MRQTDIFGYLYPTFRIDRHVRLIELFAGIGSQAKALKNLGVDFESWKVVEIDKYVVASYNAVHGTDFTTSDITKIHAADLDIRETDQNIYIMTYSFPCQDLSLAGAGRGMKKGSGTRSGLLWEVERILDECNGNLPQILLMENVPQVIGTKNIKDFQSWRKKLEDLGYSNYVDILNAKDYGIPQNRERCFMVSILGQYAYRFPQKMKLKKKLKDVLETDVPEKYYLSEALIEKYLQFNKRMEEKGNGFRFAPVEREREIAVTLTTAMDKTDTPTTSSSNVLVVGDTHPENPHQWSRVIHPNGVCTTLTVSDAESVRILVPSKNKQGYEVAGVGDGIYINRPHQKRGTVQKDMVPTIKTSANDIGVVIDEEK